MNLALDTPTFVPQSPSFLETALMPTIDGSRLALKGCGPAARTNYLSCITNNSDEDVVPIRAMVDLSNQSETINSHFDKLGWHPDESYYIQDGDTRSALNWLDSLVDRGEIDKVIILSLIHI